MNDRLGRCYELSANKLVDLQHNGIEAGVSLVHGRVTNPLGVGNYAWVAHAWLIRDNMVWEPIADKWENKEAFDAMLRAEYDKIYDYNEARDHLLSTHHYGPWHEDEFGSGELL